MLNNAAFDVVVSLVFIYTLYSLLATLIQEIIATNIGLRGKVLKKAISRMLDDDKIAAADKLGSTFYTHPLIKCLADGSWPLKKVPSYINRETFSKVVIDLLRGQNAKPGLPDRQPIQNSLTKGVIAWDPTVTIEQETLLYLNSIWADAQGDVTKFKASLEKWFDEMMDRTTGWYKKYTQVILLGVGLAISVCFNVDTVKIINELQTDPKLREQVIEQAANFTKAHPNLGQQLQKEKAQVAQLAFPAKKDSVAKDSLNAAIKNNQQLDSLNTELNKKATDLLNKDIKSLNETLAIGWKGGFSVNFTLMSLLGWLLTALALSFGAPFWFDLLNKLMQLRSSVSPDDSGSSTAADQGNKVNRVG
jgi:hypothetical protein